MSELVINVDSDGTASFIHDDSAAQMLSHLGRVEINRASHVEFNNATGYWEADMSPSGHVVVLRGYKTRDEALAAELAFLKTARGDSLAAAEATC